MIKWLFLLGLFLLLTLIFTAIAYDKEKKDTGVSLWAGIVISGIITIIVGSFLW